MNLLIKTPAAGASAQSAVIPIDNEPAPELIVEPPLPSPLAQGLVIIPYRVKNVRILPAAGPGARNVSPRVGTCTSPSTISPGCGPISSRATPSF
jgi:hypothetical protein